MTRTRFGSLVERIDIKAGKTGSSLPLLSVSQTLGVLRFSDLHDRPPRADSFDVYKVVEPGDIAFNKMSIRSGAVGVVPERGIVTYHYEVMRPRAGVDARFVVALMKSPWFIGELIRNERGIGAGGAAGVRTTEVPFSVMRTIRIPQFSVEEQRAIADYLDRETAEIDAFISDSEQMARLVDERRKAERSVLLHRLNKRVPLKRKARLVTGGTPQEISTTTDSDGVFWIKPGDIGAGRDGTKGNIKLTPHSASQLPVVESEAVVVVGIGSIGKVGFMVPPFATNQQITTVIPFDTSDPAFLYHVLADSEQWIRNSANGTTLPIINNSILGLVPTPDIPQPEQAEIVEFLDVKERQASEAIAELESAIQLAKERRAALISAAVTGQIDVSTEGMSAAEQLRDDLEVHV